MLPASSIASTGSAGSKLRRGGIVVDVVDEVVVVVIVGFGGKQLGIPLVEEEHIPASQQMEYFTPEQRTWPPEHFR